MTVARAWTFWTTVYLHTDHLGSPAAATDASANLQWREDYTPYGEARQTPWPNDDQSGFTGHIHDADTGLTYMQARYYDPVIGRFLSEDPVGFAQGGAGYFNRYAYVANDPVNFIDPTGMCTGSRIENDDGTCASTGGNTTGLSGVAEGMANRRAQGGSAGSSGTTGSSSGGPPRLDTGGSGGSPGSTGDDEETRRLGTVTVTAQRLPRTGPSLPPIILIQGGGDGFYLDQFPPQGSPGHVCGAAYYMCVEIGYRNRIVDPLSSAKAAACRAAGSQCVAEAGRVNGAAFNYGTTRFPYGTGRVVMRSNPREYYEEYVRGWAALANDN